MVVIKNWKMCCLMSRNYVTFILVTGKFSEKTNHKIIEKNMNEYFNNFKDIIKVDKLISFIQNMDNIETECNKLFACDEILEYIIPGAITKLMDVED